MAPKGMSQAEKLEKILRYFRQSGTCHTLKDLESALPSAASIHKMQIKDLIKELLDDNKIKVEKIGSGNWYWCWAGEEARDKKSMLVTLEAERSKIEESNAALNERVERLRQAQREAQVNKAHQEYSEQLGPLEDEVRRLTAEKDSWENAVAGGIEGLKADIAKSREETSLLMDNINTIEGQLQSLFNGDTAMMELIRQSCYGGLYVEGEGLPEIEGL